MSCRLDIAAKSPKTLSRSEPTMAASLRVLIIQHNSDLTDMIVSNLSTAKLIAEWEEVGKNWQSALNKRFDLIISAVKFPGYDLFKALASLEKERPDLPLIVFSDQTDEGLAVQCLHEGAMDYVSARQTKRLVPAVQRAMRKQAEKNRHRRMERALSLTKFAVDNASLAMYWVGKDGRFSWVNESGLNLLGYELQEFSSKRIMDLDPALGNENWQEMMDQIRKDKSWSVETVFSHKDGTLIPVELTANYFMSKGLEFILIFARDARERNQAEAEHVRLATAIEQAGESIMITDVDGKILYVNPALLRISGFSKDEVVGSTPSIFKSGKHNRAFYQDLWETLMSGNTWRGHFINKRKNGTLFEEEATLSPIRNRNKQIINFVAVKRDVTHEVYLEKQFHQAQKMEAIGRLAGGVAHDFNNLLTIINGYSELILTQVDENDPLHSNAQAIQKAIKRGANLTRQLLAFSHRELEEAKVIDLNTVVSDMIKLLHRLLGEDISLKTDLDDSIGAIKADPGQIEQVLINLVVNARDAMPQGGNLTIRTYNQTLNADECRPPFCAEPGEHVVLTVCDDGEGIPEGLKEKIFEPFFTTKEKGSGLGLATAFGIVKQHHGVINIRSDSENGTTFNIYFPMVQDPLDDIAEAEEQNVPRGTETVLVVEDEEDVCSLTSRMLKMLGYKVLDARHGGEALVICEKRIKDIDLLVTDIIMPHMSGAELRERLQQQKPSLKVLYMSGYASNIISSTSGNGKEIAFLSKPFTLSEIAHKVREVLDEKPQVVK
jgi:PAS domain S-box-containing protein